MLGLRDGPLAGVTSDREIQKTNTHTTHRVFVFRISLSLDRAKRGPQHHTSN